VHLFGVLDVNIFFLKTWSKLEKVDLGSLNDLHFGKEGEPNKHKSTLNSDNIGKISKRFSKTKKGNTLLHH